jgi:hypothetical protein
MAGQLARKVLGKADARKTTSMASENLDSHKDAAPDPAKNAKHDDRPEKADEKDQRGWLKRPLVWIGSLVTAVITAVVAALVIPYVTRAVYHHNVPSEPSGLPVKVLSTTMWTEYGQTMVFPRPLTLSRSELKTTSDLLHSNEIQAPQQYFAWAQSHGGVPPTPSAYS